MVNRQLEMIYILMKKDSVTAEELAAHFEVSTRTVYRDIDSLSMAGIPVYASRGKGGGIRLMERFVLDKRLLTREEQSRILAAMASLRVTGNFFLFIFPGLGVYCLFRLERQTGEAVWADERGHSEQACDEI